MRSNQRGSAVEEKSMLNGSQANEVTPPLMNAKPLEELMRARKRSYFKVYLIAGSFLVLGILLCILGGMFMSRTSREESKTSCLNVESMCAFSTEAERIKLPEFLTKVKTVYYQLHPNSLAWEPDLTDDELIKNVKERYLPYETHPLKLKEKTDKSLSLLSELHRKIVDIDKLKPRELKALEQLKHFLRHNFGVPYDEHYYNGDWMMGPNLFCWQPFCHLPVQLYTYSEAAAPSSYRELENVIDRILKHKTAIDRYRKNIQLGVKTGMVRSMEDCRSGVDAIKEISKHISHTNKSESVLNEWYTSLFLDKEFFEKLSSSDLEQWIVKKNKTVQQSIKEALIKGFGQPMLDLIVYLEYEHLHHCLPSEVSSGLVSLPVDFVYYDGKPTRQRTTKVLPTGETLDGRKSYKTIVSYFTTTNNSAEEIYKKGEELQAIFYQEILNIAKSITKSRNSTIAVKVLRAFLSSDSQWHNQKKFPENESNSIAFKKCIDEESAKVFCPVRYAALEKWKVACLEIMGRIHPQFINAFHVTGDRVTLPNCPIEMYPHFNPSVGTMFFEESDESCSEPTRFKLPFFLERYGPKFQEWSVVAHETRPGHHSQAQGLREHFHSHCGGLMTWLDEQNVFTAFSEGWALYSENPLMSDDTELYKDNLVQTYGMLKWQLWRALRLIIDTGLHHRGMKRSEALYLFEKFAWDKTDFALKDLTRYQSCPGQATAYMIGRLTIVELRRKAEMELGDRFNLKDFHYQILSHGNAPLSFLRKYIDKYIECMKSGTSTSFCKVVLESEKEWDEFSGNHVKRKSRIFSRPKEKHYV